jgi:hypothetical protein
VKEKLNGRKKTYDIHPEYVYACKSKENRLMEKETILNAVRKCGSVELSTVYCNIDKLEMMIANGAMTKRWYGIDPTSTDICPVCYSIEIGVINTVNRGMSRWEYHQDGSIHVHPIARHWDQKGLVEATNLCYEYPDYVVGHKASYRHFHPYIVMIPHHMAASYAFGYVATTMSHLKSETDANLPFLFPLQRWKSVNPAIGVMYDILINALISGDDVLESMERQADALSSGKSTDCYSGEYLPLRLFYRICVNSKTSGKGTRKLLYSTFAFPELPSHDIGGLIKDSDLDNWNAISCTPDTRKLCVGCGKSFDTQVELELHIIKCSFQCICGIIYPPEKYYDYIRHFSICDYTETMSREISKVCE